VDVLVSGKTVVSYGSAYESGPNGKFLMSMSELAIAVRDVNQWLVSKNVRGRVERLDSGGRPEWGLVDLP